MFSSKSEIGWQNAQGLSLDTATVWFNISDTIFKGKDLTECLHRMANLLLSLINIISAIYPGVHEGRKLMQIHLIQAQVWHLSDLEGMDERGVVQTVGHREVRLVSAAIKVGEYMQNTGRIFVQDLEIKQKKDGRIGCNIVNSHDSKKTYLTKTWCLKNILCVVESVENFLLDHNLGRLLTVP